MIFFQRSPTAHSEERGPMWSQELDLMTLMSPFQFKLKQVGLDDLWSFQVKWFCDCRNLVYSMILFYESFFQKQQNHFSKASRIKTNLASSLLSSSLLSVCSGTGDPSLLHLPGGRAWPDMESCRACVTSCCSAGVISFSSSPGSHSPSVPL